MYKIILKVIVLPFFLISILVFFKNTSIKAATLDVGAGQTYATVAAAHTAASNGDVILLHGAVNEGAQAVITKNVTIQGATGPGTDFWQDTTSLVAADNSVVLFTADGSNVTIQDLTIRFGKDTSSGDGGCVNVSADMDIVFENVIVENCQTTNGWGGGIAISDNDGGSTTIRDSIIRDNTASLIGGGLSSLGSSITIENTTFSGNTSTTGFGGGISFHTLARTATLDISGSLFFDNTASTFGGGIGAVSDDDSLIVKNTTFSANSAGTSGGAIYAEESASGNVNLTLQFVTFADNNSSTLRISQSSGGYNATIINSIFDCPGTCYSSAGTINMSRSYTILSDATLATTGTGNLNNTDPLLSALADNGGPTLTYAIDEDSPAYAAGTSISGINADQRGKGRFNTHDIGAFEVQDPFLVLPASDSADNEIAVSYYLTDEQQVGSVQMIFDDGTDTTTLTLDESPKDAIIDFIIPEDGDLSVIPQIVASSNPTLTPNKNYSVSLTYIDIYGNSTSTDTATDFTFDTQDPYVLIVYGPNLDGPSPITTTQIFVGEQPFSSSNIDISILPATTMDYQNFSCVDDPGAYDYVCDIDILSSGYFVIRAIDAAGNSIDVNSPTYTVKQQQNDSSHPIILDTGPPKISVEEFDIKNGNLSINISDDTGVDIGSLTISGSNISIQSKDCEKVDDRNYTCNIQLSGIGIFNISVADIADRSTTITINNIATEIIKDFIVNPSPFIPISEPKAPLANQISTNDSLTQYDNEKVNKEVTTEKDTKMEVDSNNRDNKEENNSIASNKDEIATNKWYFVLLGSFGFGILYFFIKKSKL